MSNIRRGAESRPVQVANGQVRWRVVEKDFGKGPFRWVVYGEQGGPHLAISVPFYLPAVAGERVTVTLSPGR